TKWVKHIKIQSKLLTAWWGRPIYLGATVLLPRGYDAGTGGRYPPVYQQGHFTLNPPFGCSTDSSPETPEQRAARLARSAREPGFEFYRAWSAPNFPRLIAVTFQHPTPYFDDSYAVNSANNGPYGDALLQELIPYLEEHFRMIREPWARGLTGGSTGGWEALALQVYHPDFFGGTWVLYPDPRRVPARRVPHTRAAPRRGGVRLRTSHETARLAAVDQCRARADHGPAHGAPPPAAVRLRRAGRTPARRDSGGPSRSA